MTIDKIDIIGAGTMGQGIARTNSETGNVDAVMDGDLDGFIFAYLKAASRGELQDT